MKYILICLLIIGSGFFQVASADEVSYEESWKFLYEFSLSWSQGTLSFAEPYGISTGDPSELSPGDWSLAILDRSGRSLQRHYFDPGSMASSGAVTLFIPIEGRGVTAQIRNEAGAVVQTADISGSSQCNDNGVCELQAGERSSNCQTDCGAVAVGSSNQAAAIAPQLSVGAKAGSLLLRASLGAVGIMLLMGTARMLDSRRRL